jgi:Fe-S-cluster containining protein
MNDEDMTRRSCGECNACCKPFKIPEINKHGSDWCQHCVVGHGCSIYKDRPQACRSFKCTWLAGDEDETVRPDNLGVLEAIQTLDLGGRTVPILRLVETKQGGLNQLPVRIVAMTHRDAGWVVVYSREQSDDTYENRVTVRKELFTAEELGIIFPLQNSIIHTV